MAPVRLFSGASCTCIGICKVEEFYGVRKYSILQIVLLFKFVVASLVQLCSDDTLSMHISSRSQLGEAGLIQRNDTTNTTSDVCIHMPTSAHMVAASL